MESNVVQTWSHTNIGVVKVRHTWTISNFSCCVDENVSVSGSYTSDLTDQHHNSLIKETYRWKMEANVVKTWSHPKVEVLKVSHTWTISNFSYCVQKTGQILTSETFSAGGDDKANWCLKLYPRDCTDEHKDYVSISLHLQSCDKAEINAKGNISIYNQQSERVCMKSLDNVFKVGGTWGFDTFVARTFLFNVRNKLLPDDKLSIFCELGVARNTVCIPKQSLTLKFKDPADSLLENLELLLEAQKFSDVTLIAGRREFRAHKAILAAHSPVFSAMFEHEMEEQKNNRIDIIDMDYKVVEEMLRFMYTSKAPNIDKMADFLLEAADKYTLDSLKFMCQESLWRSLAIENTAHTLVLADTHGCDWLKTQAINFIAKNTTAVMDTKELW